MRESVKFLTLGTGITHVGDWAFYQFPFLTEASIPNTLTDIATYAIYYCQRLTAFDVASDNPAYSSDNGVLFNKDKTKLIQYPQGKTETAYIIPESVTSIGNSAFRNCHTITSVTIPESVTAIETYAFCYAVNLTSVNIPENITVINSAVFMNCESLPSITIPEGVTSIGISALRDCHSLKSIIIPNSVTALGDYAFSSCPALRFVAIGSSLTTIGSAVFYGSGMNTLINYAETPQTIPANTFNSINNPASRKLFVPAASIELYEAADVWKDFGTVEAVNGETGSLHWEYTAADSTLTISGSGAMPNYNSTTNPTPWTHLRPAIKSVSIESGVTSIGEYAFANSTSLKEVSIPEGLTRIGIGAFIRSSLTEIFIPESVTAIQTNSLQECDSLTSITVAASNPNYSSENGVLFNKDKTMLVQYPIGNTRTVYAIPESVTEIFAYAFLGCDYLEKVSIPSSVATIWVHIFNGCTALTSVTNHAETPQTISATVFQGVNLSSRTLYVPAASVELYEAADVWKNFGTIEAIVPVTGVELNETQLSLEIGETETLTATVAPDNANNKAVTFGSSNDAVATVSATGLVTAVTAGTATITVTTEEGGFTATCEVTVTQPVTGVTLNETELSLEIGETATLTATVAPDNANNKAVTFGSSNDAVATVSATGLVTAVTAGAATITVTTEEGGFTATCEVTVTQPVTGVTLNQTELSLAIGATATLTATVEPLDATNQNVTWSSSNDAVATVDETGLVTAIAAGTATITVTTEEGGFTATCEVTVTQPVTGVTLNETELSLAIGKTATLTATVLPADATNQNVTWSSSNDAVATVDETGLVTAVTAGTATITVTTQEGGFTATCEVTVTGGSGIDDNTLTDITVYGNGNSVYIVNKNSVNLKSVQITDVLGRVVYNGKGAINRTRTEEIPVNGAGGIYIVRLLSDDNKTSSTKVHLTR